MMKESGFDSWWGKRLSQLPECKDWLGGSLSLLVQDMVRHFSSGEAPVHEVHHSPSCSAEVNEWIYTSTPLCLYGVYRDISAYFTLLLLYPITYFVVIEGTLLFQELSLPKGAILHLKGTNSDTTRDMIKKTLVQEGLDVVFVQFCNGCSEAWVRLQGENSSKEVRD